MLTRLHRMGEKRPDPGSDSSWLKKLGLFGVIVADLLGLTGAGIGLGYLVWNKLGFPWWSLLVTSGAGLALAMYRLFKLTEKDLK